jgi:hypothetical protein
MARKTRSRKARSRKAQRGGESNFKTKFEKLIEEERFKQKNLPTNFVYPKSPSELSETYKNNKERFIPMLRSLLSVSNTGKVENYLKTKLYDYNACLLYKSNDILTLIIFDRTTNELSEDMFNKIIVEFKNGYKLHTIGIDNLIANNFKFFNNENECFFKFLLRNNNTDKATSFIEKALKIWDEFKWKVTSDK